MDEPRRRSGPQIRRFLGWPAAEKRALIYCLAALPAVDLALRVFNSGWVFQAFDCAVRTGPGQLSPRRARQIVDFAARIVLRKDRTCLRRSLVLARLLRRNGYSAIVRIGFRKSSDGGLDGHAWCETNADMPCKAADMGEGYVRFL
jgi:hypothetical protein